VAAHIASFFAAPAVATPERLKVMSTGKGGAGVNVAGVCIPVVDMHVFTGVYSMFVPLPGVRALLCG